MSKIVRFSLIGITIGIVVFAGILPYYHFHWGVKPCHGLPNDPVNCGDGDFGGVWFILFSLPFVGLGLLGLLYAAVRAWLQRHRR